MSYDLVVFEPNDHTCDRAMFLEWFKIESERQNEFANPFETLDPVRCSRRLRLLVLDLIVAFPAMNGPLKIGNGTADESLLTDYAFSAGFVVCCFAWSQCDRAYHRLFSLAEFHRLGFYDVSGKTGQVWAHDEGGEFVLMHESRGYQSGKQESPITRVLKS